MTNDEIVNAFEDTIKALFDFYYTNSKKTHPVFNSEYDTQAYLFMEFFKRLKEKNLLFDKNGRLIFGINRPMKLDKGYIKELFISPGDKKLEKMLNDLKPEDSVEKTLAKQICQQKRVDIVVADSEGLCDEKGKPRKKCLIACEVKDSSAKYYERLNYILDDLIRLYYFKNHGYCEYAYMIFLDEIPRKEFKEGREYLFQIDEKGDIQLKEGDNTTAKIFLEKIKMYYLYRPEGINYEIERKDLGNIIFFSPKGLKIL